MYSAVSQVRAARSRHLYIEAFSNNARGAAKYIRKHGFGWSHFFGAAAVNAGQAKVFAQLFLGWRRAQAMAAPTDHSSDPS
jgi:hypothetical protein